MRTSHIARVAALLLSVCAFAVLGQLVPRTGSLARFGASAISRNNSMTSWYGAITFLDDAGQATNKARIQVVDAQPGMAPLTWTFPYHNSGTITEDVYASTAALTASSSPSLDDVLVLTVWAGGVQVYSGRVSGFALAALGYLPAGATQGLAITLAWPSGPNDDRYAGSTLTFDVVLDGIAMPDSTTTTTTPPPPPVDPSVCPTHTVWRAEYFVGTELAGSPVLCRSEDSVDHDWGTGSPSAALLGVDHYSARWVRTMTFDQEWYSFTVGADDGYRLYVDGVLIGGCWCSRSYTTDKMSHLMSAGEHTVRLDYFEGTGSSRVSLAIAKTPAAVCPATTQWTVEYFPNSTLYGPPVLCETSSFGNIEWGDGSPDATLLGVDNFSARFELTTYLDAGTWQFTVGADDGYRVFLDGQLLDDRWYDQIYHPNKTLFVVASGVHHFEVDYYDRSGWAHVSFHYRFMNR